MPTHTAEYRSMIPRTVWMTARSRNAMHRPVFIGAVSIGTFVTALVALVVMPYQAQRAAKAIAPRPGERPDTAGLYRDAALSISRLASADSSLAMARTQSGAIAQALATDTLSPAGQARRDSLVDRLAELNDLLARTENAPLTSSYRALAAARALADNPRVRALLDTLTDIDRERESLNASGGVDPVFVALTSRATDIGRAIQAVASARRDALKTDIVSLTPTIPRPTAEAIAAADTASKLVERDSAQAEYSRDSAALAQARARSLDVDAREQRARDIATRTLPPLALLAAALVLGTVLGFGTALFDELRHPRIADEHEAERIAGVRVLSVVRPRPPNPDRQRRQADRLIPPYVDPSADGHQLVYLHLAARGSSLLMLTITGDEPEVAAVIAVNLAAIAAEEARNALLIDTDAARAPVAAVLRQRAEPGVVDIIDNRVSWPEATLPATIGRNRTIDVVPSGTSLPLPTYEEISSLFQKDAARLARHYDAIVITAMAEQALSGLPSVLPVPDVIYCARVGHTRLRALRQAIDGVRLAGGRPVGVVLWEGDPPALLTPKELAAGPRPQRTSEMEAIGYSR
jgi:Mrp family chromosome partitioning ATPase